MTTTGKFVVFTEILNGTRNPERWYYGTYESYAAANKAAYELGGEYPKFYCVCPADEAAEWGIQNLPF